MGLIALSTSLLVQYPMREAQEVTYLQVVWWFDKELDLVIVFVLFVFLLGLDFLVHHVVERRCQYVISSYRLLVV